MTVVKLERTQKNLLCENLNLEMDQIIDFPPESKEQLLSHRAHSLQSSSFVTNADLICAVVCSQNPCERRQRKLLARLACGGSQICIAVEAFRDVGWT
jgi:hypothetical protein